MYKSIEFNPLIDSFCLSQLLNFTLTNYHSQFFFFFRKDIWEYFLNKKSLHNPYFGKVFKYNDY